MVQNGLAHLIVEGIRFILSQLHFLLKKRLLKIIKLVVIVKN
jgi:hypothetical protein